MALLNINDFDVLEIIGTGSYSTVHRARNKISKNHVAIKRIAKKDLSKSSTDNLVLEISLLKTLKHKHIVEMLDFRWDERNIYIIMELCNAGDLSSYIKKHTSLPEKTCKFFLRQLASALKYMRSNNVSHFDLKPQNLLLTKTPNLVLKVADFGFAQHLNLGEANNVIKGSPLYMAPEILLKHSYDPSADLWSIGVILYECLFGHAPYSSKTMDELIQKIKTKQKIEIPKHSGLSSECRHFLSNLLKHEPKDRLTFDEFFDHEFLDLKHEPSEANLLKAIEKFTKAVDEDTRKHYDKAYYLYCEGLQYYVQQILAEQDPVRKEQHKEYAQKYIKRAEELKQYLKSTSTTHLNQRTNNMQQAADNTIATSTTAAATTSKSNQKSHSVDEVLTSTNVFTQLYNLSSSNSICRDALDIGRQAEMYAYEEKFEIAIEKYKSALTLLVPLINSEPPGHRKTLLHELINIWMREAESIKSLLAAREVEMEAASSSLRSCTLQ